MLINYLNKKYYDVFFFEGSIQIMSSKWGDGVVGVGKDGNGLWKEKKAYKYVDFISLENSRHKYVNPITYGGSDNSWVHYKRFCLSFLLA